MKNPLPVVVGTLIVGVATLAMFTSLHSRTDSAGAGSPPVTVDPQDGQVQAQLAFMASSPVDLGFGASIVEMNRSIAQDQGIRNSSGGYVVSVQAGSPADRAGIRKGDVINRINGR